MSDAKLFTVAGTSIHKGVQTFRFANAMSRVAVLRANGHTDVKLAPLPCAMTKEAAIAFLTSGDVSFEPSVTAAVAAKVNKAVKRAAEPKLSDEYDGSMEATKYVNLWFARAESRIAAKRLAEMA